MVLGAAVSVQAGAAVAARVFPLAGPFGTVTARLALAAVILLLVVRPRVRGWTWTQWGPVLAFGGALGAMNSTFYLSLERIPLGVAVTAEFLGPLTLAAVLTRRAKDLVWVALALVGVAVLGLGEGAHVGGDDLVGIGFALLAGAFWAGYILASARVGTVVPGQGGLAVAAVVAALIVAPVGIATAGTALLHPTVLLLGLVVAVASSVIPYSLELSALRRLPARTFGVLLSLEPAIAALAGWVLLSQGLPWLSVAAIGLVVAASAGSTLTAPRPSPPVAPADPA